MGDAIWAERIFERQVRSIRGSAWILFDGIISLLLGLLIYLQWPSSSAWAIGTLVGGG